MKNINRNFVIALIMSVFSISACSLDKETKGEYIDDVAITSKVKWNLAQKLSTKSKDIHVETMKKTVQLSGFVDDKNIASRAAEIASEVDNVSKVENNIKVTPASNKPSKSKNTKGYVSDTKITANVKSAIMDVDNNAAIDVKVTTNQGVVTLSGTVVNKEIIDLIEKKVSKVSGVKKVVNNLVV